MDTKAREGLSVFCEALCKLEKRSKEFLEIRSRFQDDIAECIKNKEEVKRKKVEVPFILSKTKLPVAAQKESANETRKKGKRKAAKKANTKLRKRTSDDDLMDEQPLSKIRREISDVKDTESDIKIVLKETKTTQKEAVLNIIPDHELANGIPLEISKPSVANKTISNHIQVTQEDKNLSGEINKFSEIVEKSISNKIGQDKSNQMISVNHKSTNCKSPANKTIYIDSNARKGDFSANTKDNLIEISITHSTSNIPIKIAETASGLKSITNVSHAACLVVESSDLKNSDMPKKEENTSNNKISKGNLIINHINPFSSKEELDCEIDENQKPLDSMKQNDLTGKKNVKGNDFSVPSQPLPAIQVSRAPTIILSSDEESPVKKRFTRSKAAKKKNIPQNSDNSSAPTEEKSAPLPQVRITRSKMAKPKIKEINATERSGEESDTRSEFTSCSDSETGKKNVKDMVKMFNDRQPIVLLSPVKLTNEQEKENLKSASLLRMIARKDKRTPSEDRKLLDSKSTPLGVSKTTPLAIRNGYVTPNQKPIMIINSTSKNKSVMDIADQRRKEEETKYKRMKEEEVIRKKQERLKARQEELKKKTEEKLLKAAAAREAAVKEKTQFFSKLEKDREEREKLAKAEAERKKAEEIAKKKMANQVKAAEVESRRLKEEAARLARLKEMEEEQRHQEELRQKQQEENERIMKLRQEELRAKEASKQKTFLQNELLKKQQKTNTIHNNTKDKDNYSITADLEADEDEEEEEEDEQKEIPTWAKKEERLLPSKIQVYYPIDRVMEFFCCPSYSPDLTDIFGKMTMKRIRSSSAVWVDSPPFKVHQTTSKI